MERTDDGRWIVVDGRRWRATDPRIPDKLRQELVDELMSARRAVRSDPETARPRVQDAKVALGERGEPWWEEASEEGFATRVASTARALLRHRDPDRTICPSDIARVVGGEDWRDAMDDVRAVVAGLHDEDVLEVRQKGARVDPRDVRGPTRIGRGEKF